MLCHVLALTKAEDQEADKNKDQQEQGKEPLLKMTQESTPHEEAVGRCQVQIRFFFNS